MAVARKTRPTLVQSNLATFLLACLSLATCPVTLAMTVVCYAITALTGTSLGYAFRQRAANQPARTVLITGGRANKALTLCRAFKREGYRVVLAEEARWGFLTCAAFSRAVDHYHLLPDPLAAPDAYIAALTHLAAMHGADAWVPCSSVQATMVDADAALQLAAAGSAPFIPCPAVAGALHWKDQFEALCVALGYPVPESRRVTSVGDAVAFLHAPDTLAAGHRFLLKSLTLDDLGRDDLTLFPLATRGATARHLAGVPTPLSEADPFLLQRFLVGREYCTHVAARDGKVVAFVACKSNQLLMRYADVRNLSEEERAVGYRLEAWTQEFLDRYKAKLAGEDKRGWEHALTGHFSFDFIIDDDTIYVLECNVRAHTAVALFAEHPSLAAHYMGDAPAGSVARPSRPVAPRSWLAHALPLTLARLLPRRICDAIHPQLLSTIYPPDEDGAEDPTASPPPGEGVLRLLWRYASGEERDGVWDAADPVPFFVLCHVQWPWLLLNRAWRGVAWSRVNVSTSRVFEC